MTKNQVIDAIKKAIGPYTHTSWAQVHGVNRTVLADVLSGRRPPTDRLCELIGVRKITTITTKYERIK